MHRPALPAVAAAAVSWRRPWRSVAAGSAGSAAVRSQTRHRARAAPLSARRSAKGGAFSSVPSQHRKRHVCTRRHHPYHLPAIGVLPRGGGEPVCERHKLLRCDHLRPAASHSQSASRAAADHVCSTLMEGQGERAGRAVFICFLLALLLMLHAALAPAHFSCSCCSCCSCSRSTSRALCARR